MEILGASGFIGQEVVAAEAQALGGNKGPTR